MAFFSTLLFVIFCSSVSHSQDLMLEPGQNPVHDAARILFLIYHGECPQVPEDSLVPATRQLQLKIKGPIDRDKFESATKNYILDRTAAAESASQTCKLGFLESFSKTGPLFSLSENVATAEKVRKISQDLTGLEVLDKNIGSLFTAPTTEDGKTKQILIAQDMANKISTVRTLRRNRTLYQFYLQNLSSRSPVSVSKGWPDIPVPQGKNLREIHEAQIKFIKDKIKLTLLLEDAIRSSFWLAGEEELEDYYRPFLRPEFPFNSDDFIRQAIGNSSGSIQSLINGMRNQISADIKEDVNAMKNRVNGKEYSFFVSRKLVKSNQIASQVAHPSFEGSVALRSAACQLDRDYGRGIDLLKYHFQGAVVLATIPLTGALAGLSEMVAAGQIGITTARLTMVGAGLFSLSPALLGANKPTFAIDEKTLDKVAGSCPDGSGTTLTTKIFKSQLEGINQQLSKLLANVSNHPLGAGLTEVPLLLSKLNVSKSQSTEIIESPASK